MRNRQSLLLRLDVPSRKVKYVAVSVLCLIIVASALLWISQSNILSPKIKRTAATPPEVYFFSNETYGTGGLPDTSPEGAAVVMALSAELPNQFSWNGIYGGGNYMTPVKNQGACGSCWAFATVAAMEAQYRISIDDPNAEIDLSEQYVLSFAPYGVGACMWGSEQWNSGMPDCSGGKLGEALELGRDGVMSENTVPYVDGGRSTGKTFCKNYMEPFSLSEEWGDEIVRGFGIDSWDWIDTSAWNIKNYLYTVGPVMVAMPVYADFRSAFWNATYWQYHFYSHEQGTGEEYGGHAVVIVGWDDQSPDTTKDDYWIVRNSWGPGGGDIYTGFSGGYFYMTQDPDNGFFGIMQIAAVINDVWFWGDLYGGALQWARLTIGLHPP
jgi:hypothetical protein